jgi:DNA-directed RNA polymerase specialized sigma subunit
MTDDTYNSLKIALGASTALLEGDEVMYEGNTEEYIWVQQVETLMKDRLSEVQYKVFQMRYGPEDLTQSEVAKALDISLIYVKKIDAKISHLLFLLNRQYTL